MDKIVRRHVWHSYIAVFIFLAILLLITAGCGIPVTVEPRQDANGKPVPTLVSVEPRHDANGKPIPLPVAQTEPPPAARNPAFAPVDATPAPLPTPVGFDWSSLLTGFLGILGVAGVGYGGIVGMVANRLRTALSLTAAHADRMEQAETDDDVRRAKELARLEQVQNGVADLIAKTRKGKA